MDALRWVFDNVLINPMLNGLLTLDSIPFVSFGLSIILFTVIVRLATLQLTLKQLRQMRAMSALQPKMRELQEKYAKDPQERSKATMRLYKEAGVNPIGCLGPMVIQLPIWIGLYQALLKGMGTTPDHLVGLSQRLYSFNPLADTAVPINSSFLWLDLANPDPSPLIMPILVGATTWAQQKMTMMPSSDPRQASTNTMMLWMLPLMLGFFTLSFPSGLALYWVVSNLIGIAIQYFVTGDWSPLFGKRTPVQEPAQQPARESEPKEIESDGRASDFRQNRRRGQRNSSERARRKPRGGRNRNIKPR